MTKLAQSVLAACGLTALAGCSTYHSKPLDQAAVEHALEQQPLDSVKVAAASIKHPLVAPVTIDGVGGFTPDEIAVIVVIVSPELRALRDQKGVAQAQVIQAGILPNPSFNYELDRPDAYVDPVGTQYTMGLTWEITSLLSHGSQVKAAKATAKSLDLSIAWQEWQAAQDARMRAFRILSLQARLPLARGVEEELAHAVEETRKAASMGHATVADLTTAVDAWTTAQNARFDLENQLSADKAALGLSMGMPAGHDVPLKAAPAFPEPPQGPGPDADTLLQGLEDRRLDLVALRLGYESQEASLRAAVIQQFPKIGIGFVHARDNSAPPIYTNGPTVSADIPIFDRNQGQVKIAKATRQQLFDEYVARVAEARSDVGRILANLAIIRSQLHEADASLPDLEQLVASMDRAVKSRNVDFKAYRDAKGALATRQMEQSQLRQQALELGVALEIATGRPMLDRNS